MKTFPNLTSLKSGMKTNDVKFLDGDKTLPYVQGVDNQYYYFAQDVTVKDGKVFYYDPKFSLVMTSLKDLGIQPEAQ